LISLLTCFSRPVLAQSRISFMTAPFGTSSYVMGTAVEEIVRNHSSAIQVGHVETPGVAYNIIKLERKPEMKKNTIIANSPVLISMARNARGPFKVKMAKDLKMIGVYNGVVRFYVSRDPAIKELRDLKGKKVGIGSKRQTGWGLAATWDIGLGGGLRKGEWDAQWLGTKAAIAAFKDRLVDVVVGGGYLNPVSGKFVPAPFFQELTATGQKLYYVNSGEKAIQRVSRALGIDPLPYVLKPENTPGLDRPITVHLSMQGWFAYLDFPEEQAYEFTKVLINHVGEFASYHGLGKLMSREFLCYKMNRQKLHPGAYRAYKEAGLMK
jgi:hypothetical protein